MATNQLFTSIIVQEGARVIPEYVSLAITRLVPVMETWAVGGIFKELSKFKFCQLQIPMPSLEVQQEIMEKIDGYQKIICGARSVVENYQPHIVVDPEWPLVPIKSVATVASGFGLPRAFQGKANEEIPFLKVSDMSLPGNEMYIASWKNSISNDVLRMLKAKSFPNGTVIFPKIGAANAINKKRILTRESTYDNNLMGIVPNSEMLLPLFLYNWLIGIDLSRWASDGPLPSLHKRVVEQHEVPLPPLADQQSILLDIEAEQALVDANRKLIQRFERKIQSAVSRIWGNEMFTISKV